MDLRVYGIKRNNTMVNIKANYTHNLFKTLNNTKVDKCVFKSLDNVQFYMECRR